MKKTTVALTACSDALSSDRISQIERLTEELEKMNIETKKSAFMFSDGSPFAGSAREKARALNEFFSDESVTEIFDVSGGDLANGVIPYLDFESVKNSHARFWGYSDLTTVINAVYAKTGKPSVLFQARNILIDNKDKFEKMLDGGDELICKSVTFISGSKMSGTLVGGNIRCFLKLAGTEYLPELSGKILLLESLGGDRARIATYMTQLAMLGAFEKCGGVLLGTFTELDRELGREGSLAFVSSQITGVNSALPVAYTDQIGHGKDSLAAVIGEEVYYEKG